MIDFFFMKLFPVIMLLFLCFSFTPFHGTECRFQIECLYISILGTREIEREKERHWIRVMAPKHFVIRVRVSDAATLFLRSQFIPRGIPWLSVIIIIILIFGEFVLDLNLNLPQTLSNPSPLASKAIPFPFYHVIVHIPFTSSA